ncbi:MAG TPA: ribosome small subunit-dependent GTPase A [Methylophilaceae bacterium]|nr:ribosome small subunit-dependent GTPase A [Methylophilaceae bacterium]
MPVDSVIRGQVTAAYGKRYQVEIERAPEHRLIDCVTRGKKNDVACGDYVELKLTGKSQGVIETILPRSSLLYRSNAFRSKLLAANVTQVVIVLATIPSFYEELLNRCLIAAEAADIQPLILLNKCDAGYSTSALQRLQLYASLGYSIQPLSAKQDVTPLRPRLSGHTSILVGQSGMGKSTIVNALRPESGVRTQEVSQVLDSGKHTTTATHLYHLDQDSHLIDSPGLQEFGLHHLSIEALEQAFIEFRPFLGRCRFANCRHMKEPGCAVIGAVESQAISERRLTCYQGLVNELN